MGAISIGLSRSRCIIQLDGSSRQNVSSCLVCFLYHCYEISTNSSCDGATIWRGWEIRGEQGTRVCRRRTLTRAFSLARMLQHKYSSTWDILEIVGISPK